MVGGKWSGQVSHPTEEILGYLGKHPHLAGVTHSRLRWWQAQRNLKRARGAR